MTYIKRINQVVSDGEHFYVGDSVIVTMNYTVCFRKKVYRGVISKICDDFFFLECNGRSEPLEIYQVAKVERSCKNNENI